MTTTLSIADKAIEILRLTHDGDELAPKHLALLQAVLCSGVFSVTEEAEVAFEALYEDVRAGRYDKNQVWVWGVEGLTRDHQGYIYWKGVQVEHFSYSNANEERGAALALAARCKALEEKDFPVNGRTAIDRRFMQAPAGTPWLKLMLTLYTVFVLGDRIEWIVLNKPNDVAVALRKRPGESLELRHFESNSYHSGCYLAFHALQREVRENGNPHQPSSVHFSYEGLVRYVEEAGITPQDIDLALA